MDWATHPPLCLLPELSRSDQTSFLCVSLSDSASAAQDIHKKVKRLLLCVCLGRGRYLKVCVCVCVVILNRNPASHFTFRPSVCWLVMSLCCAVAVRSGWRTNHHLTRKKKGIQVSKHTHIYTHTHSHTRKKVQSVESCRVNLIKQVKMKEKNK